MCVIQVISPTQCLRSFLGIVCEDPSGSKSNWLHVDIVRFRSILI